MSEAEVRNIVELLTTSASSFIAFLTYHSYGERILTRWDHTKQILPHDHNNLVCRRTVLTHAHWMINECSRVDTQPRAALIHLNRNFQL